LQTNLFVSHTCVRRTAANKDEKQPPTHTHPSLFNPSPSCRDPEYAFSGHHPRAVCGAYLPPSHFIHPHYILSTTCSESSFLSCGDAPIYLVTATLIGYSIPSCPLVPSPGCRSSCTAALLQGRNLSVDAMTALACIYQLRY
jgi:hypothetical protein